VRSPIRVAVLAATTVFASFALAACGGSGSDGGGDGDGPTAMKFTYGSFPDYLDPALSYTAEGWTAMGEVYLPLLTYNQAEGVEGSEVVPGLAKDLPEISEDGKTYTLFLRPGLKYSDGTPVKASDFTASVERLFEINSPGSPYYSQIVGAEEFAKTKKGGISGIRTNDKTGEIAIELVAPSGTFTNELAMLFVALLPAGTPSEDQSNNPAPGTGPYMIVDAKAGRGWSYERNPEWEKANSDAMPDFPTGSVDQVEVSVASNADTQVADIERGRVQWMQNQLPPNRYAQVKNEFEGTQFKEAPTNSTLLFWLNTTRAPFDDVEVRQAVNHAVNGEALERIYAGQLSAGQQILPPGMPGYEELDLYPYDLQKAKELITQAAPSDKQVTVWTNNEPQTQAAGEYLNGVLGEIGLDPKLKVVNADNYFAIVGNESTPDLDAGFTSWFQDYPHPNNFLQPLFSSEGIAATGSTNFSRYSNPEVDREIAELREVPLGPSEEEGYAELDRRLMEEAAAAPYGSMDISTFVSEDIDLDTVIFNPTLGQLLTSFEYE
jgi:peptide/nickel transport system substrate-binding protein